MIRIEILGAEAQLSDEAVWTVSETELSGRSELERLLNREFGLEWEPEPLSYVPDPLNARARAAVARFGGRVLELDPAEEGPFDDGVTP